VAESILAEASPAGLLDLLCRIFWELCLFLLSPFFCLLIGSLLLASRFIRSIVS
jgi:hypothetical protein